MTAMPAPPLPAAGPDYDLYNEVGLALLRELVQADPDVRWRVLTRHEYHATFQSSYDDLAPMPTRLIIVGMRGARYIAHAHISTISAVAEQAQGLLPDRARLLSRAFVQRTSEGT